MPNSVGHKRTQALFVKSRGHSSWYCGLSVMGEGLLRARINWHQRLFMATLTRLGEPEYYVPHETSCSIDAEFSLFVTIFVVKILFFLVFGWRSFQDIFISGNSCHPK